MDILKPVYETAIVKTVKSVQGKTFLSLKRLSKLPAAVKGPSDELWTNFNDMR